MLGAMLTEQQERFCQAYIRLANQSAAYRECYNVAPDAKWTTVAQAAHRLIIEPEVAARIQHLRDEAARCVAMPALSERIKEQRELEAVDPRELLAIHWDSCRFCWSVDHHYHWVDEREYAQAVDRAIEAKQGHPDMAGGFGFNPNRDPCATCTHCWGVGVQRVHIQDTRKLSRAAARLYRGIKVKADGSMEILLYDQQKTTDMLNRMQGGYKEGVPVAPEVGQQVATVAAAASSEDRVRGYLRLVAG